MSSATTDRRWRALTHGLGFRLNAFYVLLFLGSLGVLFVLSDVATRKALEAQDRHAVLQQMKAHTERYRRAGVGGLAEQLEHGTGSERVFVVRLATEDNRTVLRRGPPHAPADGALNLPAGDATPVFTRVLSESRVSWTLAAARLEPDRVIQVGLSDAWREATLEELRKGYLWVLGTAALLGLLGGAWLTRRTLRPIRELAATTQRVADEGDLSARVPRRHTGDELDRLAALFNEMLERNQRLVGGMRGALDHVAHDLRTPMTRLRASAEVALRDGDPEAQHEALADVVEESDRVLAMLRTMMDISEAEAGVMKLERLVVDLAEVVRDVADLYEHVADEAGVELSVDVEDGLSVSADGVRLRQALANLVDNAVKYTPRGGRVAVAARREGGRAVLSVRDDGIGIPKEALPRIWERLYRADPSRHERGIGLGLSLVKAIVEAHGGETRVESEPGRGSTFELLLPVSA